MVKTRMTAKRKIRVKKYRQLLDRNNKRTYNSLAKVFVQFGADAEKDLIKVDLMAKISWKDLQKRIKNSFKKTISLTINSVSEATDLIMDANLKRKEISSIKNLALKEYNSTVDSRLDGIIETTKRQISLIIDEGQRLGVNKRTIASNIADKFKEISRGRAKTIARTETSKATSITTNKAAEVAQMKYKIWIHTGSGKIDREQHVALSGVKLKIDELFDVNGFDGKYPHDPDLPASEVVNCGCVCIYE